MKPIRENDTIQIEITNVCNKKCANCTRLVWHHEKHYFMDVEYFKQCVDSLKGFRYMIGVMGGEPLFHPQFEEICEYLHDKHPPEKCGLWTAFPEGKEKYAELICKTFGHIFPNDHTRDDVMHQSVLVAAQEVVPDYNDMWYLIDKCWMQHSWSASVNPKGAFFCEIAASLAMLFKDEDHHGWDISQVKDWWAKAPIDYVEQQRKWCPRCSGALSIGKRASVENKDDISPGNYELLKESSPRLKNGDYEIHNLSMSVDSRQFASYKDQDYRDKIADRYGIVLMLNKQMFLKPMLKRIVSR